MAGEHRANPIPCTGPRVVGEWGQKAAWCVVPASRHASTLPAEAKWMALGRAVLRAPVPPRSDRKVRIRRGPVVGTSSPPAPGGGRRHGRHAGEVIEETAGRAAAATTPAVVLGAAKLDR